MFLVIFPAQRQMIQCKLTTRFEMHRRCKYIWSASQPSTHRKQQPLGISHVFQQNPGNLIFSCSEYPWKSRLTHKFCWFHWQIDQRFSRLVEGSMVLKSWTSPVISEVFLVSLQVQDLRDIVTFILHTAKSPHDQVRPGGFFPRGVESWIVPRYLRNLVNQARTP